MDQWRAFFADSGTDIWTVIEQAIILAARDYPKEFRNRRGDIAETLFARRLLEIHSCDLDATRLSGSVVTNATNMEENDVRDDGDEAEHTRGELSMDTDKHLRIADALNEEMEEETSVIKELYRIKENLMDSDQSEKSLLELLQRLQYLQITVEALGATKIGRQVNNLRKHHSKRVRSTVKQLVSGWKDLVDEWVKTAGDITATDITGDCDTVPTEQGFPSPSLVHGDLLAASTTSLEIRQFLSFVDEELPTGCREANKKEGYCVHLLESAIKDHVHPSAKFQSRSMQVDSTKHDPKASNSNNRGIRVPEERKCGNRVGLDGPVRIERRRELGSMNSTSQNATNLLEMECNGMVSTSVCGHVAKSLTSQVSEIKTNDKSDSSASRSSCDKSWKPFSFNRSTCTEDMQKAEKLELAKRKLHEGYQQAENAKKQRTVQLVDLPDLPKEGFSREKVNSTGQNRLASQNWHWNQSRR